MNSHAIMADFKRHINDLEKPQKFIGDKMIDESDKTLSHLSLLGLLGEVRSIWSCGRRDHVLTPSFGTVCFQMPLTNKWMPVLKRPK